MGELWDCIEKAKRQGEVFSAAERQRIEQEYNLRKLENRIDDLQEQIVELKRRGTVPNAAPRQAHPQYSFTEWLLRYGHQDKSSEYGGVWMIEEVDVVDWLKRCGLEDYI